MYPSRTRARLFVSSLECRETPAIFVVSNINDAGAGSLRQAVLDANAATSDDTITFSTLFNSPQTITLTTGEMAISGQLTISGPGSALTTITGNKNSRIFNTASAKSGTGISISGLTLTGGKSTNHGGAIFAADETLTLSNCVVSGNSSGNFGGGVAIEAGGTLTATDCSFLNNTAFDAGAFDVYGATAKAILRRCLISGNSTTSNCGGFYASHYLLLDGCTVSANMASGHGGGIMVGGSFANGALTIRNSTISGNVSKIDGGGVYITSNASGTLVVQNSSIVANIAGGYGGGIVAGGIISTNAIISLESSIVYGNTATIGPEIASPGTVRAKTSSLYSTDGIKAFTNLGGNRPFGENPLLGPLANNGGLPSHALTSGSPCINVGSNPASLTTDGRGTGYVRVYGGTADMGAFEVQPIPVQIVSIQVNDGSVQRSRVTSLKVTFTEAVSFPSGIAAAFQLQRTAATGGGTLGAVNLNFSQSGSVVTITFVAGGPVGIDPGGSLADGKYQFSIVASKVQGSAGTLDGNGNGVAQGSPTDDRVQSFHRLFGDSDGNGTVNATDLSVFRTLFGLGPSSFDFNNDGQTNSNDLAEFRKRFGVTIGP